MMPDGMESPHANTPSLRPNPGLKLGDQVREVRRYYRDADRTAQASSHWIRRDLHYVGGQTQPHRLGTKDVERFLSPRAPAAQGSASPQRRALNALVVLSRDVLDKPLESKLAPGRSPRRPRPPPVLTQAEVQRLLTAMTGRPALMARLLSGGGLRLLECLRLCMQDVDFDQNRIVVRGGTGGKDRTTILPHTLRAALPAQIEAGPALYHQDLEEGFGAVSIPEALARQSPKAARETG